MINFIIGLGIGAATTAAIVYRKQVKAVAVKVKDWFGKVISRIKQWKKK